jgi:hypothetical protein
MDWLPTSIDAMTRLAHEIGGGWLVALVFSVGMIFPFIVLFWRHSSAIVKAVETMANAKSEDAVARQAVAKALDLNSGELVKQTRVLEQIAPALAKLQNWPDRLDDVCKHEAA